MAAPHPPLRRQRGAPGPLQLLQSIARRSVIVQCGPAFSCELRDGLMFAAAWLLLPLPEVQPGT